MNFIKRLLIVVALATSSVANAQALPNVADVVERVAPLVVVIKTFETVKGTPDAGAASALEKLFPQRKKPDAPQRKPGPPGAAGTEKQRGLGSGFVIDSSGVIMTNAHVVDGAERIEVSFEDGRKFPGTLIGKDERSDVALIRITPAAPLPQITVGTGRLRPGDWVIAIGSPFGMEYTVTTGVISNTYREAGDLLPSIQIDAAVNPGNSGGPLFNMKGEVIGVNSQIFSKTGVFAGIALAIPIGDAMKIAAELYVTGKVTRGRMAVVIGEVDADTAKANKVTSGVLISDVEAGGPADLAGLKAGDIIIGFNGERNHKGTFTLTPEELPRMVSVHKPGERVYLLIVRNGVPSTVFLTLAPEGPAQARKPVIAPEKD